ncbi:MAG: tRNA-dependent cyclodipeptide synthase [Candidatus Uhrbacteria bacterium]|nr:tRNA-dependent cyclodipeptide synthase [Candidatus Uhrbacteria bacterium]
MRIASYFNTLESDVNSKRYNIFIGVSLGNAYFTKGHIKEYIRWALAHTKEKVAILIPDQIHAINYEVRNGYSKERSARRAFREGEKVQGIVVSILAELIPEERDMVTILTWEKIETEEYQSKVKILYDEFKMDDVFRKAIIDFVRESVPIERFGDADYERLAEYPLRELPLLISGFEFEGVRYGLLPYPGISGIDHLVVDLQENKRFVDLAKRLNIDSKLRIIEAYADEDSTDS